MRRLSLAEALLSANETKALYCGPKLIPRIPEFFREQFPQQRATIITDEAARLVAGNQVAELFEQAGLAATTPFVFSDPRLYAEHSFVEQLERHFRLHDAVPIAVGSGTINDLVKLAAHRVQRPYAVTRMSW